MCEEDTAAAAATAARHSLKHMSSLCDAADENKARYRS